MEPLLKETIDVYALRKQFPVLNQSVHGKQLVYLDNAATTQKPQSVIDALVHYYQTNNANIHRGIHTLAERATADFETTRKSVQTFLNAEHVEEIIFVKGVTEGINLIASSFGKSFIKPGDEIIISTLEHHSNTVPWQFLVEEKGAVLKIIPVNEAGEIDVEAFETLLSAKTRIVSIVHVSNALGTVNPVKEIIQKSHERGIPVVLDGAQSAAHLEIDVQELSCDFYVFSGHKIYGPTGVGILYGKKEWLEKLPPYQGGGEMIKEVTFEKTTYNELPYKFEAGTPSIADVVALRQAIDFINTIGKAALSAHEDYLLQYATEHLPEIPGLKLIGTAQNKIGVNSFIIEGVHHQDVGVLLDHQGIAIRTGHHCTQPLMKRLGITGTCRASYAAYTTVEEIDLLLTGLKKAVKMLR